MNNEKYEQQIKKSIYEAIIDSLKKYKSCKCDLFVHYNEETRSKMLQQIISKKDLKLTQWEVLIIILKSANKIQTEEINKYPIRNATDTQLDEFAKKVSNDTACYFSSEHTNTIFLPIQGMPEPATTYLINKQLPNFEFTIGENGLQINLAVNGPLISGGENIEIERLNNLMQTIFGVGLLLDFFNMFGLEEKAFNIRKANFSKKEEYVLIENLLSTETDELAEQISVEPSIGNDEAEKFFMTLSKIFNHTIRCDEIVYSLTWYCKSLGGGDIKTKFICRYIGFEALSGIWTKTNKNEKSLQDKVKYTIPALLAKDIDDIKKKQELLKNIIDLRNELFHGDKNDGTLEEFGQKMSQHYARLGEIYKELFLHTINKL